MALYTPTVFTNGVTLRDKALFNKRENGIGRMHNYRCAWMQGTTNCIGDSELRSFYFDTYGTGAFFSSSGEAYTDFILNEGSLNYCVRTSDSPLGAFSCAKATLTIEPLANTFTSFYPAITIGANIFQEVNSTQVGNICIVQYIGKPIGSYIQAKYQLSGSTTAVKATFSVLLF